MKERLYVIKVGRYYVRGESTKRGLTCIDEFVASDWTIFTMQEVTKYLKRHNTSNDNQEITIFPIGWTLK